MIKIIKEQQVNDNTKITLGFYVNSVMSGYFISHKTLVQRPTRRSFWKGETDYVLDWEAFNYDDFKFFEKDELIDSRKEADKLFNQRIKGYKEYEKIKGVSSPVKIIKITNSFSPF